MPAVSMGAQALRDRLLDYHIRCQRDVRAAELVLSLANHHEKEAGFLRELVIGGIDICLDGYSAEVQKVVRGD